MTADARMWAATHPRTLALSISATPRFCPDWWMPTSTSRSPQDDDPVRDVVAPDDEQLLARMRITSRAGVVHGTQC